MPIAGQRDPEATRAALTTWLQTQLPGADGVTITDLVVPQSSGFSNETFLFSASWHTASGTESHDLVLRSQPQEYALFPEIDLLAQQYQSMKLLENSNVPVARMRFAEADTSVLGQPFFVMDRLHGRVPGDQPPYTEAGFVMDMSPAERARQWRNGIEALTKVAQVDWRAAGFQYLDKPHHGKLGGEQRRNYFKYFLDWATEGKRQAVVHPAWEWLEANWPDNDDVLELCWGDSRPGNQMYDDHGNVLACFDWEMVSIGDAESDLGWWLFLQLFHTEGSGRPLPEGIPDHAQTVAIWSEFMGREPSHVDFYIRLAGFHFSLVMLRISAMMRMFAPQAWAPEYETHNPVMLLTKQLIGLD